MKTNGISSKHQRKKQSKIGCFPFYSAKNHFNIEDSPMLNTTNHSKTKRVCIIDADPLYFITNNLFDLYFNVGILQTGTACAKLQGRGRMTSFDNGQRQSIESFPIVLLKRFMTNLTTIVHCCNHAIAF
jgi:hypothetical protein